MRNITLVNGKNVIVNENDLSDIAGIVKEECSSDALFSKYGSANR